MKKKLEENNVENLRKNEHIRFMRDLPKILVNLFFTVGPRGQEIAAAQNSMENNSETAALTKH
jgi:hypothetical protein